MPQHPANALQFARSAYLRSAIHQPVQWNEWGAAAFNEAQRQDKPILLDIGAVWCHWCHVMDRESYEDAETARLINEHFIAIKVDRDERPDVDSRYQAAVAAISGQGGWPLTAFLTPGGQPYFGGTYFPPVDGHGRPSLRRVLMTMAEAFEHKRGEVDESAASVIAAIEHNESFDGTASDPSEPLVMKIVTAALKQFDPQHGGFGSQPKFPNSAALDLLMDTAGRASDPLLADAAHNAALVTLQKMSRGGIYDHLAGGFHRYSVDERWVVPHFEKMSYDNSELLHNYVHAFQLSAEPECARIARETLGFVDMVLSDQVNGGFYSSQDADETLDDDGDYFTWTLAEARAALTAEQLAIAAPFYDIGELGDMHHNPQKNTLHVELRLEAVAKAAGQTLEAARANLVMARERLHAARLARPTPFVDRTIYVGWNAIMISAYLTAGRVLPAPKATAFALKSLDRTLAACWNAGQGSMTHVVAYGEASESEASAIPGTLEDYVFSAHAALDAWEATGGFTYFQAARAIAEAVLTRFLDPERSGFFDTETPALGEQRLGALTTRRKPLQDAPTPAGNPVAAALLLRLAELTGEPRFREVAKATLECFAAVVEHLGLFAATYALALRRLVLPPVQVVIVGEARDAAGEALAQAANAGFAVNRTVIRLTAAQLTGPLPPALAETLGHLRDQAAPFAVLCSGFTCQPPIMSAEALREALRKV